MIGRISRLCQSARLHVCWWTHLAVGDTVVAALGERRHEHLALEGGVRQRLRVAHHARREDDLAGDVLLCAKAAALQLSAILEAQDGTLLRLQWDASNARQGWLLGVERVALP